MDVVVITSHLSRYVLSAAGTGGPAGGRAPGTLMVASLAMSTSIDVVINGQPRKFNQGTTLLVALVELGLDGKRVAVERNREVVPRAQHADTVLAEGDRLEVVTFVGGG